MYEILYASKNIVTIFLMEKKRKQTSNNIKNTRSVQKVSSHVAWKSRGICWRRYKTHCTQDNDASVPFKGSILEPHTVLPITISRPVVLSWISMTVRHLSLSKVFLVWGKARSYRAPNLGCSGAESPGWFDVSPQNSARDVVHEQGCYHEKAANHQLPIAATFYIIQIVSTEEC